MACAALQCTADCLQSEEDRQVVFACNLVAAEPFWGGLLQVALHCMCIWLMHCMSGLCHLAALQAASLLAC